jgi:hypothetical protein
MTLQEQYNLIKEGKGAKDVFTKHAKSLFPHLVPNHYGFDNTAQILTQRGIISENLWGIAAGNNQQPDWFSIFNESLEINTKADAKKPAKEVEEYEEKSYDSQYGAETGDDVIFDQYINGIQIETCNPKNADKTVDELKKMVLKNLKKDKLYYTKNAAFGVEGIGYTDEAPGLGKTKEVKGKYASSGMEPVKINEGFDEDKIARYKKYTYTLDGETVTPDDINFYDHLLGAELDGKVYKMGAPDEKGNVELKSAKGKTGMFPESAMYGDSDGDRDYDMESMVRAEEYYDKGLQAYSEGDLLKAEKYYDAALKAGSWLGWTEFDLPPYETLKENNLNEINMEEYIVWIQPEGEEKREHHRAKSKPEAERIARMVYGNYYDDYNPPKIGIMPASEWSQETSLDNMNIQESKLRSAIRSLIKEELNLKEIDQIGEEAQKMAKSKKIDDEVNKRKKKLKALETLKELEADSVNPGKIKELYKEIKTLEKLKEKLEKKGKKKEQIIDEETYIGTSALDDLKKDPKFNSLRSDAKASAEDELKKGGSVTVENKK